MAIMPIEASEHWFCIDPQRGIAPRAHRPGPPERPDGFHVGLLTLTHDAPHDGEMHPDGDELLYVISGSVEIRADSQAEAVILRPGQACIVPRGEWHKVHVLEPTEFLHITPGPGGDHRPL